MNRKNNVLTVALSISLIAAPALAENVSSNWFRNSAISPNGETILFSAQGDIYQVPATGGDAVPIVSDAAWDGFPVWSNDGDTIAFASDRNGSLDVYVMSLSDRTPQRLTYHSADDYPTDFSPNDKLIIFNSGRLPSAKSSGFPTRRVQQLYSIPVKGGTPTMELTTAAMEAKYSPIGKTLVYMDNKAYEDIFRKHDKSSFARDIWRYTPSSGKHTKLTNFAGGDSTPVWSADGKSIYFLSEKTTNNFNVWKMDTNGGHQKQISNLKTHPVRSLSISNNGTLAYSWHGELFTQREGNPPTKLNVNLTAKKNNNAETALNIAGKITNFETSPDGKEVAFISRGELFVSSVEFGTTVRLSNTAEQERGISWFPDGRSIAFSAERDGVWGIYKISIVDKTEPYFFAATKFKEKTLLKGKADMFQPVVSPDGKQLAHLYKRDEIRVLNLKTGKTSTVFPAKYNYSYSDGDIEFAWSPDSKWIASTYVSRGLLFYTDVGIAPADGSKAPVDVSMSGYGEYHPRWNSGELLTFVSERYGMRSHGSWGSEVDVMGVFLTQNAYDKYLMSKEERKLFSEQEKKAKKKADKKDKKSKKDKKDNKSNEDKQPDPVKIHWKGLDERIVRLTKHSSNLSDYALTPDQQKLYYIAKFEKGYDLWEQDFSKQSTKLLVKLKAKKAKIELNKKGDIAVLLTDGSLSKINLGKVVKNKKIKINGTLALKQDSEREYLFKHLWRQTKDKFYSPSMHGIDWNEMYKQYHAKARKAKNNRDFAVMTSEMLGELNASHTGTRYRLKQPPAVQTASLGLLFPMKPEKKGLKVEAILPFSPLLKFADKVKTGSLLTQINGKDVNRSNNLAQQLNGLTGKRTRLTFITNNKQVEVVVRPNSLKDENKAMYKRWVDGRREYVNKLSGGKLAYVHIPKMDDSAYRNVHAELFGRGFDKQAVVVDTRFNRGGWLTDDLITLLSGREYNQVVARGTRLKGLSIKRWTKPSILVVNEGNYSDGYCFPKGYKANNMGKIVGMPVPGTCTAVWWEELQTGDLVFGIPQLGVTNDDGSFMENDQLKPDIKIENSKETVALGEDEQLKRAVEELL